MPPLRLAAVLLFVHARDFGRKIRLCPWMQVPHGHALSNVDHVPLTLLACSLYHLLNHSVAGHVFASMDGAVERGTPSMDPGTLHVVYFVTC